MAKRNTISGISINSNYISLVTADLQEAIIQNMSIQPLDVDIEDSWERLEAGLTTLFDEAKLKGENIAVSLPAEFAIIKVFDVDPQEEDLDEFLEWELSQQIVGNLEDYVFDYERLKIPGEGETNKFFVTAYRKNAVDKIVKLLKSKKQHPIIVEPDIFSLINIYELNYSEYLADPTLIIFCELNTIKVVLTKDGHFIDLHTKTLEEESSFSDELKKLCDHILQINQEVIQQGPLKVVFSGDFFSEEENVNSLKELYPNSEILSPFNKIKDLSGWSDEYQQKYLPRLPIAVGLAIRDADLI